MDTNLSGRLRNTNLPKCHGLLPLYEAVVNSIHAIEEAQLSSEEGKIDIIINRKIIPKLDVGTQDDAELLDNPEITGFDIIDNGIGFTDDNLQSFQTLDSDHKIEKGARGIGRLLWLKAFNSVKIESQYFDKENKLKRREIVFTSTGMNLLKDNIEPFSSIRETKIHLLQFDSKYQKASVKTIQAIATHMVEHCLWYFIRQGSAPKIRIIDGETIEDLDNVFADCVYSSIISEQISIKKEIFELIHVKFRTNSSLHPLIAYCAGNRLVKEESITGKIPGLFGKIQDSSGDFIYSCYISSKFLDDRVRAERIGFDIEDDLEGLFEESDISLKDINKAVLEVIEKHLKKYLSNNQKLSHERVEKFVNEQAPRYRPILSKIPKDALVVDPNISNKDLELVLHKHLVEIESDLIREGHDIMQPDIGDDVDSYKERLKNYLSTLEDIKKSDLANYVSHRKVIIDILGKAIERQSNGKYVREDLIHQLIMPMGKESKDELVDQCNLWLIDERLAFHNYLASDKTLRSMPITNAGDTKEPDILGLNIYDNPLLVSEGTKLPLASITVVEIKRPMRDDATSGGEKDPIEQALDYLDRIRKGHVKTASGRDIPDSSSVPGFCYVLCDITPTVEKRCKYHNLKVTSDKMGYFGYNDNFNAYIEVISFDRLVNAAKERNRAFFDKLGLPTT